MNANGLTAIAQGASAGVGFVEAHEEETARAMIHKELRSLTGKQDVEYPRPAGYYLTVKIYVRPEELSTVNGPDGKAVTIWAPPSVQRDDKYQSVAALVVAKGPQAYRGTDAKGNPKFPEGDWCRVGDWVVIPRYESHLVMFHGIALGFIPDDRILAVIQDPRDVMAVNVADRI